MAANTAPIFVLTPKNGWTTAVTAANTATDGTGTVATVITAGADGAFVEKLRFQPLGTNIATMARVFINNGSTNATADNNVLIGEFPLPLTTASAVAANPPYEYGLNIRLAAGYKLNFVLATAVAAGYRCVSFGGDY